MTDQTIPADKLSRIVFADGTDTAKIELIKAEFGLTPPVPLAEIKFGGKAMWGEKEVLIACAYSDRYEEVKVYWLDDDARGGSDCTWAKRDALLQHPDDADTAETVTTTEHTDTPKPGEAWEMKNSSGEVFTAVLDRQGWWHSVSTSGRDSLCHEDDDGLLPCRRLVPETPRKTLVTEEDYGNALAGTVVKGVSPSELGFGTDKTTIVKLAGGWFEPGNKGGTGSDYMAGTPRKVLWEPEA